MAAGDVTADRAEASKFVGASFDGVDDYVEIPHHASQLGANLSNGFTISVWIFPIATAASQKRIFDKTTATGAENGFALRIDDTNPQAISFRLNAGTVAISANLAAPLRIWTHVIITVSSAQLANIYINGVLSGAANQDLIQTIATITTTNAIRIGNRATATDRPFDGCIKDVKMWNRVLSAAEIAEDYAGHNIADGQILWVPLCCDYNDRALFGLTGTNSGTYLTNTISNRLKVDADSLNLAAATDKIIALPITGRAGQFTIVGANRAAA